MPKTDFNPLGEQAVAKRIARLAGRVVVRRDVRNTYGLPDIDRRAVGINRTRRYEVNEKSSFVYSTAKNQNGSILIRILT